MAFAGKGLAIFACAALAGCGGASDADKRFDPKEVRVAEAALAAALQEDGGTWVSHYTEDAVFQEGEGAPVVGRKALTELAAQLGPLSSISLIPLSTEGQGNLAVVRVKATYAVGRGAKAGPVAHMQGVMVWRKETDGQWRMLHEALVPEVPPGT